MMESYRNAAGWVCHRTTVNVGFIEDDYSPEQLNQTARLLTAQLAAMWDSIPYQFSPYLRETPNKKGPQNAGLVLSESCKFTCFQTPYE
jgi:hypothetical protein